MRMKIKVDWKKLEAKPEQPRAFSPLGGDLWNASVGGWYLEVSICALLPLGPNDEDGSRWSAMLYAPGVGAFGGNLVLINRKSDLPSAEQAKERCEQMLNDCVGRLLEEVLEKRLATPTRTETQPVGEESS